MTHKRSSCHDLCKTRRKEPSKKFLRRKIDIMTSQFCEDDLRGTQCATDHHIACEEHDPSYEPEIIDGKTVRWWRIWNLEKYSDLR